MTITVTNLTKIYSKNIIALSDISLSIDKGLFGLLGRNGSGKTTLLRILTTLLEPTEGNVELLGMESNNKNATKIKECIGYLPQEFGFYKDFSVLEIMQYISILRNIDKDKQKKLIDEALEKVAMSDNRKKKYKQLSGGMKRRVGLAQAMLDNPPILIVDEPTAGVDPEERIRIRKLLSDYGQNNTVLFSTHIVEDIEYTCNKLAVLDSGKLLFSGSLNELLSLASGSIFERTFDSIEDFRIFEETNTVISFKREDSQIRAIFISHEGDVPYSKPFNASLEEAYVYITTSKGGVKHA